MAVTVADIKTRFPAFSGVDASVIERLIDEACRSHCEEAWGGKSDDGLAYLTAHLIAAFGDSCSVDALGAGPITSSKEGQVSSSISPLVVPDIFRKDDLSTTPYGRRYLSLRRNLFVGRCT